MKKDNIFSYPYTRFATVVGPALFWPALGFCDFDSSLDAIQMKLTGRILPAVGILGLIFAGLSFFTGSQNARQHLSLAIIGAVVGFGAPAIIHLIQSLVH